jgi:catechol 2,3-dioxygenase-like lactoylglutathione lyase family enzyme
MRWRAVWFALTLTGPAGAQAPEHPPARPVLNTAGSFFGLSVADIVASTRWYRDKLGLTVVMEVPGGNGPAVTTLEGGGLTVELVQHPAARPLSQDAVMVHGFFKAGVVVDDFEATLTTLRERRIEIAFGPFPARNGQRANVIVRDNAGNLIQVIGR